MLTIVIERVVFEKRSEVMGVSFGFDMNTCSFLLFSRSFPLLHYYHSIDRLQLSFSAFSPLNHYHVCEVEWFVKKENGREGFG